METVWPVVAVAVSLALSLGLALALERMLLTQIVQVMARAHPRRNRPVAAMAPRARPAFAETRRDDSPAVRQSLHQPPRHDTASVSSAGNIA